MRLSAKQSQLALEKGGGANRSYLEGKFPGVQHTHWRVQVRIADYTQANRSPGRRQASNSLNVGCRTWTYCRWCDSEPRGWRIRPHFGRLLSCSPHDWNQVVDRPDPLRFMRNITENHDHRLTEKVIGEYWSTGKDNGEAKEKWSVHGKRISAGVADPLSQSLRSVEDVDIILRIAWKWRAWIEPEG